MSAYRASAPHSPETDSGVFFKVAVILLGFAVSVVGFFALMMWVDAREARDVGNAAQAAAEPASEDHGTDHNTALPLNSFAGIVPPNAQALAEAHKAYDATLPPASAGSLVKVHMTLKDMTVEVAPGVKYSTWSFDGHGAPGPVVHVREGQTVEMTLTNGGAIPHSIDFHAARIAPDVAFKDVMPGKSFTFRFKANDPGVYMYHCGTKPVLAHIANGMYGAIVVTPVSKPLPKADKEYVLVASEWYLSERRHQGAGLARHGQGARDAAGLDDLQRVREPVRNASADCEPGRQRAVLGRRGWSDARQLTSTSSARSSTGPGRTRTSTGLPSAGVQTVQVPAGGGGVFDVKIDEPGLYPFVSHAFAHVDLGQVGLLKVGNPKGTMSH